MTTKVYEKPPLGPVPRLLPVGCGVCMRPLTTEEAEALGTGTALDHWPCGYYTRSGHGGILRDAFPACYYSEGMGV